MSRKSLAAAFVPATFAGDPGHPAPPAPAPQTRSPGMMPRQRLTSAMAPAVGVALLTPDQTAFRANATGRWGADPAYGAHAPAYMMKRHPDGTVDTSRLEPDGAEWLDLGGKGGRDVGAGRAG